jgi:hypothetical protein
MSLVIVANTTIAQNANAERSVISSAGNSSTVGNYTIDWTVGETITETLSGSKKILTQGLHQALMTSVSTLFAETSIKDEEQFNFSVFPNPFVNTISIKWQADGDNDMQIFLFDINGKIVYQTKARKSDKSTLLSISDIPHATYFLVIADQSNQKKHTYTLIKK